MKIVILVLSLIFGMQTFAQKECEFTTNISDSIGTYKETKDFLMHEKVFGGKSTFMFFSLVNNNGTPLLKVQRIIKSADFIGANCFDNQSKIYFQLQNGKIVTLLYGDQDTCGILVRIDEQKLSTRILSGNFLFITGSIEDLKSSPITLIRIKYSTDIEDIVAKKELTSELMNQNSNPERFFIEHLQCVID